MPNLNSKNEQPKDISYIANGQAGYSLREAELEGRSHWIVPCVLLVEGVHNGSRGAIYYSPDVISQHDIEWNGKPVTLVHPADERGEPQLCATSPDVYNKHVVGKVFHAHMHNNQLKAELWIDQSRLRDLDPALADRIRQREPIEVSTGLVPLEVTERGGTWRNEEYVVSVTTFRPDHLALLSSQRGACSLEDGCGIHNRKEVENVMGKNKDQKPTPAEEEVEPTEDDEEDKKPTANGCTNFKSTTDEELSVKNQGGKEEMPDEVKDKVDVAANAEVPKDKPKVEAPPQLAGPVTPPPVANVEEYLKTAPPEIREVLTNGLAMVNRRKAELVGNLLATAGNVFAEEELNAKSVTELEKISALIPKVQDNQQSYIGNAGGIPATNGAPELTPLAVPGMADFGFGKK